MSSMSTQPVTPGASTFHSGFACFVGRPNAGKSTLTNALVGRKIAIESSKPQTTRHAVRGIVHRADAQLVLIDTPGLHKPRTLLGERLNDVVRTTWSEVDVVGVCLPSNERIGPGDRYLVGELAALPMRPRLVAIATKSDVASPERMAEHLLSIAEMETSLDIDWADIVPVSVPQRLQLDVLIDTLIGLLPDGPPLYPGSRDLDRLTPCIRHHRVDVGDLPEAIATQLKRGDHVAEPPLTDVECGSPVVVEARIPVRHHHLGKRHAICDVSLGSLIVKGDLVDHRTFTEVESEPQ